MANSSHSKLSARSHQLLPSPTSSLQPQPAAANTRPCPTHLQHFSQEGEKTPIYFNACTYIYAHIDMHICIYKYLCKQVYIIHTDIKIAVPAGSSHLPKPSKAARAIVFGQRLRSPALYQAPGHPGVLCPRATQGQVNRENHAGFP